MEPACFRGKRASGGRLRSAEYPDRRNRRRRTPRLCCWSAAPGEEAVVLEAGLAVGEGGASEGFDPAAGGFETDDPRRESRFRGVGARSTAFCAWIVSTGPNQIARPF